MERIDVVLNPLKDREKVSRKYQTADEVIEIRIQKSIEIQRMWRSHLARAMAREMRKRNEDYTATLQQKLFVN